MTLRLSEKWVWDFWFAREDPNYHIFYLQAPRAIGDEQKRHWHVSIGHAISQDLVSWEILPDAFGPSSRSGDWDDYTTWTSSIYREGEVWYQFYTGTNRAENGLVQRIGLATSRDLSHWERYPHNPVLCPDTRWYEVLADGMWLDQAWRDPWVFRQEGVYHAYITARTNTGDPSARGVIAHATSNDLLTWKLHPPVTEPGEFCYLEVPQLVEIGKRWYLVFSVTYDRFSKTRLARPGVKRQTGTHYLVAEHYLGPFHSPGDNFLVGDLSGSLYSGKLIQKPTGDWVFLAFKLYDEGGRFIGEISDPYPLEIGLNGELSVDLKW